MDTLKVKNMVLSMNDSHLPKDLNLFKDIVREMESTYIKKNSDYGNSFEESMNEFGMMVPAIKLSDKYNRLKSLAKGKEPLVKDESIEDTLLDMANYAIMSVMWLRKNR